MLGPDAPCGTDADAVFRRMVLMDKNPPRDWAALVAAAQAVEAIAGTAAARDRRP